MRSEEAYERLRVALRSELQRNFGRIQGIERELSRSEGYLSRFCRGEISIPVDVMLKSLELLNAHPGRFFGRALGTGGDLTAGLRDMADPGPDKSLARILKSMEQLSAMAVADSEIDQDGRFETLVFPPVDKDSVLADGIRECSGIEQRRRLKTAKRYRTPGFTHLYTSALIQLCYNDPRQAAKQAEIVIADLIPEIPDLMWLDRLNLALRALSAWGFAYRMTDQSGMAALAACSGLRFAGRFNLATMEAEFLRLGAYLLADESSYEQALQLLGHAAVIFDELDQDMEVGKVQVQRGIVFNHLNDHRAAFKTLNKSLKRLPAAEPSVARYRASAFAQLSRASRIRGDLDAAGHWLDKHLECLNESFGIFVRGKTLWEKGNLHYEKGELTNAEQCYIEARALLFECDVPQDAVLVSLDLTRVWLDQHKFSEAVTLAKSMACMLHQFRKSAIKEAALMDYIRAAQEGMLSMKMVETLRSKMNGRQQQRRGS